MSFADATELEPPPPPVDEAPAEQPKAKYFFLSEDRKVATPRPADEPIDTTTRAARTQILMNGGGRIIVAMRAEDGSYVDLAYASTDGWRGPGTKPREPHRTLPRLPKIRRPDNAPTD